MNVAASSQTYTLTIEQRQLALDVLKLAPTPLGVKREDRVEIGEIVAVPNKAVAANGAPAVIAQVKAFNYTRGLAVISTVNISDRSMVAAHTSANLTVPLSDEEESVASKIVRDDGGLRAKYGEALQNFELEYLPFVRPSIEKGQSARLVRILMKDGQRYVKGHPTLVVDLVRETLETE